MRRDFVFDVLEHAREAGHLTAAGFVPDDVQRYDDRITGQVGDDRASITVRAVGFDNADTFRRWVTMSPAHWGSLTSRPGSWKFYVLMVGLLPDGEPWWSRLYFESILAQHRDESEQMGGFYRFDPGLTGPALLSAWDKDKPEQSAVCPTCGQAIA